MFGKSTFLEKELEAWALETWAWLTRNLGGAQRMRASRLILPNREFFPATEAQDDARARYIFEGVKRWMGLSEWPCVLEPYDRPQANAQVDRFLFVRSPSAPNGTFRVVEGQAIVSYASDLLAEPQSLIATFAHELAHYVIATIQEPIPGGHDVHELTTELTVAFSGFGVFAANSAFEFAQHGDAFSQGWRSRSSGYFSERSWAFALALFSALAAADIPLEALKPSFADLTKGAQRYLKRNPALLDPIRAIA